MGMEGISDKVNINVGEGRSGGGAEMAALVAALGSRNQGNDHAALIAALGNRNGSGDLAPLMAMMHNRDGNDNDMGGMWPLLLLLLLGRGGHGGGGLFGGGDGDCGGGNALGASILQTLTEGQSEIRAQIPTVALENQNAMLQNLARFELGVQQGLANVNQNVSAQGCQTREAIVVDGEKTRSMLVTRFGQEDATKIAEQNARILALETRCDNDRRHGEATLQITNTNTAVAAQAQFQAQLQQQAQLNTALDLFANRITGGFNQTMLARQGQDIVNLGTMNASGTQAAANTQVR